MRKAAVHALKLTPTLAALLLANAAWAAPIYLDTFNQTLFSPGTAYQGLPIHATQSPVPEAMGGSRRLDVYATGALGVDAKVLPVVGGLLGYLTLSSDEGTSADM